jgi:putative transposase
LGTGARGSGAVDEAGYLRFSAYGPRLLASRTGATRPPEDLFAELEDVVRNHAQSIVACDFLVVVTARFRTLYVFLLMEVGTRRIVHCNVTAHPTAAWTLQQLREAIPSDHSYRFLIHDHDSIFSAEVDQQLKAFGLRVLHTPARAPKANAYCERLVESVRR